MNLLETFIILGCVFILTLSGVEIFRRWSLKRELLDVPNERSSHSVPTPRGGGLIIFLVSVSAFFIYAISADEKGLWSFFAGALIVGTISLIDDLKTISAFARILFHCLAAALLVWSFGGFEQIWVPFWGVLKIGAAGYLLAFLWIVWMINAYNFMDGIDGIAATQAITAGIGWALTGYLFSAEKIWVLAGVLTFSALGFLILNWQPAKIFMGDVGSAFLGYSFAALPLLSKNAGGFKENTEKLPVIAVLFVWFFVFDSVYTLLKRLFRGEKVWQAHRQHIYQRMVISGYSHAGVTLLYGLLSICLTLLVVWGLKVNGGQLNLIILIVLAFETAALIALKFTAEARLRSGGEVK